MTEEAANILSIVREYMQEHGSSPSIRDIAGRAGISPKSVLHYLFELEAGGFIKRSPYRARTIQLLSQGNEEPTTDVNLVPLVGMSAGGPTMLAQQNIEEYLPVSIKLVGSSKNTFLLKVKGSSMQPYIDNGDIAVVQSQNTAVKGEIVVACIENDWGDYETTIKEYYPTDGDIILKAINPKFEPMLIPRDRFHIQGIVKGVIKYLG